jgi:hypothetical protein
MTVQPSNFSLSGIEQTNNLLSKPTPDKFSGLLPEKRSTDELHSFTFKSDRLLSIR